MLPKYEQIKQDLLREIKNHTFIPGDKFYSEADIKRKYAVSSITAVKALNELTSAGYLYRIQGKGTFVSKSKVSQNVKFSDIELHSLDSEKVKVLSIEEENQAEILKELAYQLTLLIIESSVYAILKIHPFSYISHIFPKSLLKSRSQRTSQLMQVCMNESVKIFQ